MLNNDSEFVCWGRMSRVSCTGETSLWFHFGWPHFILLLKWRSTGWAETLKPWCGNWSKLVRTTLILLYVLGLKAELEYRNQTGKRQQRHHQLFFFGFFNACSLYGLAFPNFLAQMIHQPQKHLMGHIYLLYLFIRFLMQEIAFFHGKAISPGTRLLYICKRQKLHDEILYNQETGNLETLSLSVVLLSITTPEPNPHGRSGETDYNAQKVKWGV